MKCVVDSFSFFVSQRFSPFDLRSLERGRRKNTGIQFKKGERDASIPLAGQIKLRFREYKEMGRDLRKNGAGERGALSQLQSPWVKPAVLIGNQASERGSG